MRCALTLSLSLCRCPWPWTLCTECVFVFWRHHRERRLFHEEDIHKTHLLTIRYRCIFLVSWRGVRGGGGERVFDEQPMTRPITLQFEEQYEWTLHVAVHRMNHNEWHIPHSLTLCVSIHDQYVVSSSVHLEWHSVRVQTICFTESPRIGSFCGM